MASGQVLARSGSLGFVCGVSGVAKDDARARTQAARDEAERESQLWGEQRREQRRREQERAARREQARADSKRIAVLKQHARFKALLVEQARLNGFEPSPARPGALEGGPRMMPRSASACVVACGCNRRVAKGQLGMSKLKPGLELQLSPTHAASGMRRVGSLPIPLNQLG